MIEDETPVEPVDETAPEGEPQPTDENGDVIAPPADDAPEAPDAGDPPSEDEAETAATEVIGGTTEPEVLDSGDVLPEHRRRVDGV